MKLRYESGDNIYVLDCTYDERLVAKQAGFRWTPNRWNPPRKIWWTNRPENAAKLIELADDPTRERLASFHEEQERRIEMSSAANADIDIPAPAGLEYLPFQKAGIQYALQQRNTLLGDAMGLGKTIQAAGLINALPELKKILIIVPASLKLNWRNELKKWLVNKYQIGIVSGSHYPLIHADQVVIINYDLVKKHADALRETEWDLLVADECHYMKNSKALRTKYVLGAKGINPIFAKRKLFLTGTPILNRPIELWTLLHALDPQTWSSWKYYVTRYCDGHQGRWGWDVSGSSNRKELQTKLRSTIMVRRLKEDVLKELPSKFRQVIEIPADGFETQLRHEQKVLQEAHSRRQALKRSVEAAEDPEEYKSAVQALNEDHMTAFEEMSRMRHETAIAKIPAVIEHCKDALESSEKIVVFAHHHDVIDALLSGLSEFSPVEFTGRTPMADRERNIERFQNDPDCRVFVGSITAAGVGITLTAASHVIFAELDWVPGNITQAEDRCHRIGQHNSVLVQHIVLDGSLDANMAKTLVSKQSVIEAALDSGADIELLNKKIDVLETQVQEAAPSNRNSTGGHREQIQIPDEQAAAIHEALQILAGMCDGAATKDGHGFNKLDAYFGHSLATQNSLSQKQIEAGKKLLKKYHQQIPERLYSRIYPG